MSATRAWPTATCEPPPCLTSSRTLVGLSTAPQAMTRPALNLCGCENQCECCIVQRPCLRPDCGPAVSDNCREDNDVVRTVSVDDT